MNHKDIINASIKWCKSHGYHLILEEFVAGHMENPDVLAFGNAHSLMIEVKVSRQDFLKDAEKFPRRNPKHGVGNYRYYACPEGLIKENEIPKGWGLIYIIDKKAKTIKGHKSNCVTVEFPLEFFNANLRQERTMLMSALRRVKMKEIKNCNYKVYYIEEK